MFRSQRRKLKILFGFADSLLTAVAVGLACRVHAVGQSDLTARPTL
jgi:hypothetical protein